VYTLPVALALAGLSVGTCLANISAVNGAGATATTSYSTTTNFDGTGFFDTSIVGDTLTSASSQIAFTYAPPPNYSTGDRVILQVINGTGSTLSNFFFTLSSDASSPPSSPQYYDECTGCNGSYPGVPSAGAYNSIANTYTTASDLTGDLNSSRTVLNVPLTLAPGKEQDFYFAVNYTGTPGDFTLTQSATPEPSFYGVLAIGLSGLVLALSRRRRISRADRN